jgi:hypothetical protein
MLNRSVGWLLLGLKPNGANAKQLGVAKRLAFFASGDIWRGWTRREWLDLINDVSPRFAFVLFAQASPSALALLLQGAFALDQQASPRFLYP